MSYDINWCNVQHYKYIKDETINKIEAKTKKKYYNFGTKI